MHDILSCDSKNAILKDNISHQQLFNALRARTKFTLVNVYVDLVVFTRIAGLHRPEVVDIGVNTIYKNMPYA